MDNSDLRSGDTLRIMNHWRLQEESDVNSGKFVTSIPASFLK